jgi:hypothetical protein
VLCRRSLEKTRAGALTKRLGCVVGLSRAYLCASRCGRVSGEETAPARIQSAETRAGGRALGCRTDGGPDWINIDFLATGSLARLVTLSERYAISLSYKGWLGVCADVLVHLCLSFLIFSFSSALRLPVFFCPRLAHYPTQRGSRCLSAFYLSLAAVRVHRPCEPFALVQSGCFSYGRWWWAQTAGFAIVGKCCCCKAASFSAYLPIVFRRHTLPNATWQPLSFRLFHFPIGSPSASSLRTSQGHLHSCNWGASRTVVGGGRRQRVSRSRGSAGCSGI